VTWAFPIPPAAAVVTTTYVTRDGSPILLVSRELAEDGDDLWQFHCGNGDYEPSKLQLVRLDELVRSDPTLASIADLAMGYTARRASVEKPWTLSVEH
jgi:hypothetical protein